MKIQKYRVYSDAFEEEGGEFYKVEDMELYFNLNRLTLLGKLTEAVVPPLEDDATREAIHDHNVMLTQQLQLIAPVAEKMLKTHNDNMVTIEMQGKRILELLDMLTAAESVKDLNELDATEENSDGLV